MTRSHFLPLIVLLAFSLSAFGKSPAEQIKDLLPGLNARKIEDRADAQRKCESICLQAGAPNNTVREPLCRAIGELLGTQEPKPHARIFLIKQLERIGGEESVPTLVSMLQDKRMGVRDAARRALATNPSSDATKHLSDYYATATEFQDKKSTLNALGYRFDSQSIDLLTSVAKNTKGPLKVAAINAMSKSATDQLSPKSLRGVVDKDALLRFADSLADQGKVQKASGIYRSLLKNSPDSPFALAALRGLLKQANDDSAVQLVLEALTSESKTMQQVGTGAIRTLTPIAVDSLAEEFDQQDEAVQRLIIMALGTRNDGAGRKLVSRVVLSSDDSSMRRLALEALGGVGDEKSLALLIPLLVTDDRDIASASIMRLKGNGVDEVLVVALNASKSRDEKSMLLRLLLSRRAINALPNFVSAARSDDSEFRDVGISALSRLGEPSHLNVILDVNQNLSGKDRERAEKLMVNMCRRNTATTDVLLSRFGRADKSERRQLVSLLGRVGEASSLKAIRGMLDTSDEKSFDAAVAALANWPNHEVAADLKKIASTAKKESQAIRALRGLARVCVLGGTDPDKLAYLKFVLAQATRSDEKILALERAKAVRTVDSLQFVLPYIEHPKLGARAQRTVVDLAHHRGLREPNRDVFEPALSRVAELLDDQRQQERIRKYLANE